MSEIKPCPEITQTQLDAAGFAISGCTEKQWVDASEGTKDLFRDDARAAIEAAVRAGFGASDACASVQKERDELREMLGEAREAFARIADPDRFCGVPIDSEACNHFAMHGQEMQEIASAFLARYEGGR